MVRVAVLMLLEIDDDEFDDEGVLQLARQSVQFNPPGAYDDGTVRCVERIMEIGAEVPHDP